MLPFTLLVRFLLAICFMQVVYALSSYKKHYIRVYMPNLPDKYTWALYKEYSDFSYYYGMTSDEPFGEPIPSNGSLWTTNQFAAGLWAHMHISNSRIRTATIGEADIVFVPIFATYLVAPWFNYKKTKVSKIVADFYSELTTLLPFLTKKPHFIILPRIEFDYRWEYGETGGSFTSHYYANFSSQFTFLTIEIDAQYRNVASLKDMNKIAIPYPSIAHLRKDHGNMPNRSKPGHFEMEERKGTMNETLTLGRNVTASCAFGLISVWRKHLHKNCMDRPNGCSFLSTSRGSDFVDVIPHMAELTRSSWFCIQPAGDSYSRRSLFDCLLQLTIPVVFDDFWIRAFPFADILDPLKIIADLSGEVNQVWKGNVIDILEKKYPMAVRLEMLTNIAKFRHLFSYSLEPSIESITVESVWRIDPEDDALTQSIKAIVRNACRRKLLPPSRCIHRVHQAHMAE